jgi:hypothetical protein
VPAGGGLHAFDEELDAAGVPGARYQPLIEEFSEGFSSLYADGREAGAVRPATEKLLASGNRSGRFVRRR